MSKVAIKGASTGTGTFTIESPATNTDRTLSLPDATGTILTTATAGVPVNGPAFSAYVNLNQSISANTATKVQFNAEEFDTNSNFDSTTNYRFTPTVAGYYQLNTTVYVSSAPSYMQVMFYKNGANYKQVFYTGSMATGAAMVGGSTLAYMNGTTDYIEVYATSLNANTISGLAGSAFTQFSGSLIRSAT